MKYIVCFLLLTFVLVACTSKQKDGVYIGQKINDFIAYVQAPYEVKKEMMQMEGDDYDVYNVYENGEKIYSVEPDFDKPNIV